MTLPTLPIAYPNTAWACPLPCSPQRQFSSSCCRYSQSRLRPLPILPTRMGRPGSRSPRLCRANTAANASGELATEPSVSASAFVPPLHISLHCPLILGVWNMFRDTSGHIPKRNLFLAAGLAVGKRLDDGQLAPFLVTPMRVICSCLFFWGGARALCHMLPPLTNPPCSLIPSPPSPSPCVASSCSNNPTHTIPLTRRTPPHPNPRFQCLVFYPCPHISEVPEEICLYGHQ